MVLEGMSDPIELHLELASGLVLLVLTTFIGAVEGKVQP